MVKNNILLLIAHILIFSGCVSTMETVETKEPVPKVTVGMNKAVVLKILSRPDFTSSSEDHTIFFYCAYLEKDTSKGTCTPIFFQDDIVVYVGEKNSQKWKLETVRFKVKADRKKKTAKKESKKVRDAKQLDSTARDAKRLDSIAVETLTAQKTYTPNEGETVYVNYYTNFVRYIPLRSNPSNNGEILKTICIGSELGVLSVHDRWLYEGG